MPRTLGLETGAPDKSLVPASNTQIATKLLLATDILVAQNADPFRVAAYRRPADVILNFVGDLAAMFTRRTRSPRRDPGHRHFNRGAIAQMITIGRWSFLDHLRGSINPETLFCAVPGVSTGGPDL